jgi:hypothetical protein
MLAPLMFPVLIWVNHCIHSDGKNIRLEMLKSDQRIMDEFFHKMRTGQYARHYTGPVGPQGPQGLQQPKRQQ